jgi:outer membrane autotransporter protein
VNFGGSFLVPELGGGYNPEGTTFDVVFANTPIGTLPTIIQPTSPIIYFTEAAVGNFLELTLHRNSYSSAVISDIAQLSDPSPLAELNALEVAAALDSLAGTNNPDLLALFGQLDIQLSPQTLTDALESLIPSFNNSLVASAHISMDNAFKVVERRIEDLFGLGPLSSEEGTKLVRDNELYNGVNYGDIADIYGGRSQFGVWAEFYGDELDQRRRHNVDGFLISATGLAIGGDWDITRCATFGMAGSYTKANDKDKTAQQDTILTRSAQFTLYSYMQPYEPDKGVFLDAMIGVASHQFETLRNIVIGNIYVTPQASFYGLQYGAQVDLGYAFVSDDNYYVAPLGRVKYTYLNIDNYTEYGAGGLDLSVANNNIDELIAGVGLKLALKRDYIEAQYIPEFSFMAMYDFSGAAQEMESNFLGGGGPFYTNGIKPAQAIFVYGIGLSARTSDNYIFNIHFDFEKRDHFYGYNAYIQLERRFG